MEKVGLSCLLEKDGLVWPSFFDSYGQIDNASLFTKLQHDRIFSEDTLHSCLHKHLGYSRCNMATFSFDTSLNSSFYDKLKQHECLPLYETVDRLALAVHNPFILEHFNIDKTLDIVLTPKEFLLEKLENSKPITLNTIINTATTKNASDIHFYSQDSYSCDIFFRINGSLCFFQSISKEKYAQILQQVKLDASLDLGVYKTPQEGYLNCDSADLDIRVSIIPTVHLEDIVLRLFKKQKRFQTFYDLTSNHKSQKLLKRICDYANGLILVTGPTGSGKTTTLYSMLRYLKLSSRGVIVSLEDPVENQIYGIRQSHVIAHKGYTFDVALKAVLRQDPDVILVGEIRDKETARIAIEAAYTGHLVLSSLHTHDIYSTLLRLKSFGLDEFLLQYVLRGIIAQKLVGISCKCNTTPCTKCNGSGVLDRQLNQEILHFNAELSGGFSNTSSVEDLGDYKGWD